MNSRKHIVISGYYGFANMGDEAVLAGILTSFREVGLDAECTVLSANPSRTTATHDGVSSVHRYDLRAVLRAIRECDLFISGGGSLVQDTTSARSAFYYLAMLRLAQIMGRKTMVYAQGVGPLRRRSVRSWTASAFSRASAVTVRDSDSEKLLRDLGVVKRIEICADPAFLVQPDTDGARMAIGQAGLGDVPVVGVAPRDWPGANLHLIEVADGVERACESAGIRTLAIPMHDPDDISAVDVFAKSSPICCGGDFRLAKGIIGKCNCIVGMRLHSLIFAAECGVPFVAISYDPKVASFAESAGMPCIDVLTATSSRVKEALSGCFARHEDLSEHLRGFADEMRKSALRSARIAQELLQ